MTLSQDNDRFLEISPIKYHSAASGAVEEIAAREVVDALVETNRFLESISKDFRVLGFDLYQELQQRNLSGFVGEVFTRFFAHSSRRFVKNPHADGRPDLLDVVREPAAEWLTKRCHLDDGRGNRVPDRSNLAPFKYGGLEIKASIGSPRANHKVTLRASGAESSFQIGMPRVTYLGTITYWAHHVYCDNLVGLYYDFYAPRGGVPQVLAVMHAELDAAEDWAEISVGKPGSKKTSNTSLTASGRAKMFGGVVAVIKDETYRQALKRCGLSF
jgi:hypothetical protein